MRDEKEVEGKKGTQLDSYESKKHRIELRPLFSFRSRFVDACAICRARGLTRPHVTRLGARATPSARGNGHS
jgi:hypothetical protein